MNRRTYLFVGGVIAAVLFAVVGVWRFTLGATQRADGRDAEHAAGKSLPLSQVVLFNSGVGYFQREGVVEGNTRVDLTFPVSDVNDLLKSLVLPDLGNGKVSTVSYDSEEPVEKTLKSFALDLTNNPTLGQIINQARGEKIEVVLQQNGAAQPGNVAGIIIGMEVQHAPNPKDALVDVDVLNLLCAEGVRGIPLSQVQRLRFLNASLDSEFRRALEVLAAAHNSQKRTVSLNFVGEGKRTVKVGYVVENPIWKTSYRLVLDKNGKPSLHGWAIVENTSDEDWTDVRMALISSRPISFQMDLYQPLFVPRPTVEPELFASLRPPTYQGALNGCATWQCRRSPSCRTTPSWATVSIPIKTRQRPLSGLRMQQAQQAIVNNATVSRTTALILTSTIIASIMRNCSSDASCCARQGQGQEDRQRRRAWTRPAWHRRRRRRRSAITSSISSSRT